MMELPDTGIASINATYIQEGKGKHAREREAEYIFLKKRKRNIEFLEIENIVSEVTLRRKDQQP